jgi:hypothetical protein
MATAPIAGIWGLLSVRLGQAQKRRIDKEPERAPAT